MKEVINVTATNFEKEVLKSDLPVVLDFWAEWCSPCKMIAPTVDALARDYKGKINVAKIDVDSCPEIAQELGIMNIPTIAFFKDGREYKRMVGINTKSAYEKIIKEILRGLA